MFIVYVLYSQQFNKIYIGFTSDVNARIESHNSEKNTGYTKRYQPWAVFYTEQFETKKEAMQREKELKSSRGRNFIWNKIIREQNSES